MEELFKFDKIRKNFRNSCEKIDNIASSFMLKGVVTRSVGLTLEAKGFKAPVGTMCKIITGNTQYEAVITGFYNDALYLMPTSDIQGLEVGAKVVTKNEVVSIPVGSEILGRVIDSRGNPLDDLGELKFRHRRSLYANPVNPLTRDEVKEPLDVGIRAINGLLTIGKGQRIGLFAGSGVGKSILLGMISKFTEAEIVVVGLIGERGREVKDFIVNNLGKQGLKKTVVVATPADYSPILKIHGTLATMTIAEYFSEQGKNVLVLMDSLTRFAQAQREVSLAMGEPPATKGYPPSVFAMIPQLVERAGNGINGRGSITGIFTVLAEADDVNDPVVDSSRAILDGHILLSRELADLGHYPAIDINKSVSRVMNSVVNTEHAELAIKMKRSFAIYQENKDLLNIGAYAAGANLDLDFAVQNINKINQFLNQSFKEKITLSASIESLKNIVNQPKDSEQEISKVNDG